MNSLSESQLQNLSNILFNQTPKKILTNLISQTQHDPRSYPLNISREVLSSMGSESEVSPQPGVSQPTINRDSSIFNTPKSINSPNLDSQIINSPPNKPTLDIDSQQETNKQLELLDQNLYNIENVNIIMVSMYNITREWLTTCISSTQAEETNQLTQPGHRCTNYQPLLLQYLQCKKPDSNYHKNTATTLDKILNDLKIIIFNEQLYDKTNPSIIICDAALETALNTKMIHILEVKDTVLSYLSKSDYDMHDKLDLSCQELDRFNQFSIKNNLHEIFVTIPNFIPHKQIFTYLEISNLCLDYLNLPRDIPLFDERNSNIWDIRNTPLGNLFQINYFHKSQIPTLLKPFLIPLEPFKDRWDYVYNQVN